MDPRPLVRVATAGSVDDGKSTFIGRLLHDCNSILDDQYEAIERASRQSGETEVNLALLTDGLRAERTQKITIDVAYRHFATESRRFLLADTPGHAQYTRNMFVGASTADIAVLLVDAERGPTPQTRRHAFLASLLRVPHVLVAVNKMDAVEYRESRYREIVEEVRRHAGALEFADLRFIPISALKGDNVARESDAMPWYSGPSVLAYLDEVEVGTRQTPVEFRLCVQTVIRPDRTFRGYAGKVLSGSIRVGEEILVQPSGLRARVARLSVLGEEVAQVELGRSAVVELADELDVVRGDFLVRPGNPTPMMAELDATVCWMGAEPLRLSKSYRVMLASSDTLCEVDQLLYEVNPETLHREHPATLQLNSVGRIRIRPSQPIPANTYAHCRETGAFLLVDSDTNEVSAAGILNRATPAEEPRQSEALVVWLTGLSGAGKSTLANGARDHLRRNGRAAVVLDGDSLRSGLNRDLGFSEEDRTENIRRTAEIAKLLAEQGVTVFCALISPLASQREMAKQIIGQAFREVYVSCALENVVERDPKGLYARAAKGEIANFTGVSSPYEPPTWPDLILRTDLEDQSTCSETLRKWLLTA